MMPKKSDRPRKPLTKMAGEPRSFIGRIESAERHSECRGSRWTFIIDAVDTRADPAGAKRGLGRARGDLAILRVMTTADRLAGMAEIVDADSLAGRWVEIRLVPRGMARGPRVQVCPLGDAGYEDLVVYTLSEIIDFGFTPTDGSPRSRRDGSTRALVAAFYAEGLSCTHSQPPRPPAHEASRLRLVMSTQIERVIIHDVGHANFTTLLDVTGKPVLHFDVGWPIGFNWKTYPPNPPIIPLAEIVVLTHWDWDHLHGFHKWKQVRDASWFVPEQSLGPNALLVYQELAKAGRLTVFPHQPGVTHISGPITVIGADPSGVTAKSQHRNNSGISMVIDLMVGGRVMLPGDADYVATGATPHPDLLVVSHHGAKVLGKIPKAPAKNPRAVVSMGEGNCYQHPSDVSKARHTAAGWALEYTSATPSAPRGDKFLP